jgi:DNA invertase Pin-like site-specific DNA recombinase
MPLGIGYRVDRLSERETISKRTKDALLAAKARGTKLGGFRAKAPDIRRWQAQGVQASATRAQDTAEFHRDDIEPLVREGLSLRRIAAALNDAGILSPRSKALNDARKLTPENKKAWSAQGVANVVARLRIDRAGD